MHIESSASKFMLVAAGGKQLRRQRRGHSALIENLHHSMLAFWDASLWETDSTGWLQRSGGAMTFCN